MIPGLVSTVVPVFNRPRQLRAAITSVLEQDYTPIEVLIVDDGSTDETFRVAQSLAKTHPATIQAVTQLNAGPGVARERGRRMARGEFIQYLDSDDVLLPKKFSAQVRALQDDPQAVAAYGITYLRTADGQRLDRPHKRTGERIASMFPAFLVSRWWETATPLYRSSATDLAGPWSELLLEEDWEYDCRIASYGGRLAWVPQPVSEHRDHAGPRLSRGPALDAARMRQRASSHTLILSHALRANIPIESSEMQNFARALFLLARQCGAAGLPIESRDLFNAACSASGAARARGLDFRAYRSLAGLLGWGAAGKASQWLDNLRGGSS